MNQVNHTMICVKKILVLGLLFLLTAAEAGAAESAWVHFNANHELVYSNDDLGNHIPDFSYAGFGGGGVALPTNAPIRETLNPVNGDNTANIQNALNFVGHEPPDTNGFRGVVLLNPGIYELDGSLALNKSGVILRGSGSSPSGTVLHFVGNSRQTITMQGSGSVSQQGASVAITDPYVPLGATNFHVSDASGFSVGDLIVVQRPVTQTWIDAIGMSNYWSPNSGLHFERTITAINGNQIGIDIPLFNPIEQQWCVGDIYRVVDDGRMTNSAVEDLRIRSDFSDFSTNWGSGRALNIDNAENCWIRNVVVDNYYNGINSGGGAKWLTIEDCYFVSNAVPPSRAGSAAFGGAGQMILWQRCGSSNSTDYHVFVTQAAVPGPNVFLNFKSDGSGYDSGAHQRWAAGVLFDNDTIASDDGGNTGIKLENRGSAGSGQGYAAGYSLIYNGNSPGIINEIPQVNHHYNWAIGGAPGATFIHRSDDGIFDATNGYVNPRSLYLEQLKERLGGAAVENIGYLLFSISTASQPLTVVAGASAVGGVNVGDPTLMSNIVALSVGSLPPGISANLSANSITGAGSANLTVTAANSVSPGNYSFNVIGSSAGATHTSVVNLAVTDFALSVSPSEQTVMPGAGTTYTMAVSTNQNFAGTIGLGLSGLPAGANASFSPDSFDGTGSSTLNIATATNTPAGDYLLAIYGTNGDMVASTTVTLHVVTSLVAWLTFDDGTAHDFSGHGNNGVLVNGATIVNDPQRGKVLSLDGVNQYVDLGNAASLDLSVGGQATIAAWVKVADIHNHNSIVTKGEWNEAYSLLIKGDTSPPNLLWTGHNTSVFSAEAIPTGVWTHVAVTINGSLTTFYINGQISGATNQNRGDPIDNTSADVCIGREQYSGSLPAGRWFFNGELDDVRIYNVALTQSQIQYIMNNVAPSFANDPLIKPVATAGQPYSNSLAGDASDPDAGDFLTFSKISGPAWLNVAADGALSGTPLLADTGTNSFIVRVTDSGGLFSDATLNLIVMPAPPIHSTISEDGTNLVLTWVGGVPEYQVQMKTNLLDAYWQDFGGPINTNRLVLTPTNAAEFYRIEGQ
jgi:Concanavalin A-like lectin/glucanases superfamily/Putative Ig domain